MWVLRRVECRRPYSSQVIHIKTNLKGENISEDMTNNTRNILKQHKENWEAKDYDNSANTISMQGETYFPKQRHNAQLSTNLQL